MRSSAYGVLAAAGRIGSVAGQYSAAAGVNSPAHTFAIAAAVLFAAAIASTALPSDATLKEQSDETQCTTDNETRKRTLNPLLTLFVFGVLECACFKPAAIER